ncbi:hypothetical protein ACH4FX_03185 [Streptomyces sp. NPDC018019]|uniref:hypothetical protein n=1 Tax=Streptomyces sp. NPDC018019 TaxID=3365030 RepID=UPI0037AD3AFC
MITREHLNIAATHLAFVISLALIASGAATDNGPLAAVGACLAFALLPGVILSRVRRHTRISRDSDEALRREGYRLCLEHCSRGLITPPNGDGTTNTTPDTPTVRRLHAVPAPRSAAQDEAPSRRTA